MSLEDIKKEVKKLQEEEEKAMFKFVKEEPLKALGMGLVTGATAVGCVTMKHTVPTWITTRAAARVSNIKVVNNLEKMGNRIEKIELQVMNVQHQQQQQQNTLYHIQQQQQQQQHSLDTIKLGQELLAKKPFPIDEVSENTAPTLTEMVKELWEDSQKLKKKKEEEGEKENKAKELANEAD